MIRTYVGPMFSGKSDSLITIYNKIWNKKLVLAFKPKCDSRDGASIKSKNYDVEIPAIYIKDLKEIKKHIKNKNIHTIFIDEAKFLTGDGIELVQLSVVEET